MALNALGLTGRALYLMPEYMRNKPVNLLIGEGLVADDFNDDTLGRALDEVQQAGVTELFARVASRAVEVFEVETSYAHLDTSSISLHGEYASPLAQRAVETFGAVQIRHRYSKEHRPDLKQVVVSLITNQASALPLWLEVLDGNSSDKESFPKTIQAYCRQLQGETPPWFVMDSAGYSQKNLASWQEIGWVTRVPETVGEAKAVLQAVERDAMEDVGDGYRICPLCNTYADIRQRWLLVYSRGPTSGRASNWTSGSFGPRRQPRKHGVSCDGVPSSVRPMPKRLRFSSVKNCPGIDPMPKWCPSRSMPNGIVRPKMLWPKLSAGS